MIDVNAPLLLWTALTALHYASPILLFCYFISATTFSICTLQGFSIKVKDQHAHRDLILWLMISIVGTYAIDAVVIIVRTLVQEDEAGSQSENVYVISSFMVWLVQVMTLADAKSPVWYPYFGNWIIGIFVELAFIVIPNVFQNPKNVFDFLSILSRGLRIGILVAMCCTYFGLRIRKAMHSQDDPERQSLLGKNLGAGAASSENQAITDQEYGTTSNTQSSGASSVTVKGDDDDEDSYLKEQDEARERIAKRLAADGNWWTYAKGFTIFLPHIWPVHSNEMIIRAVLVAVCLLTGNALNVLIPRQLGIITDALFDSNGHAPWLEAATYAAITFANSDACIGWIQFWLWLPLEQQAEAALQVAAHTHVMNLSSDFHDSRDSSDIIQAIHQGKSITKLVETVCLQVVPMFINLLLAFAYLYKIFGPYMGLDTAITSLFYLYTTTKLVSMVSNSRRSYILHWRKQWILGYAGIDAWLTASYFNNISYETDRYNSTTNDFKRADRVYRLACRVISAAQGLVMTVGLLGGCFLAIYQVVEGKTTPGNFVMLLSYWAQLKGPLSFFSGMYKDMSECLMDAERMLELFQTKTTIVDKPNAAPLNMGKGEVRFDHVNYSYDPRKPALKDINFVIPGGSTIALVGETGSGKSTILKLIDRFYDVETGSITIDGQDVRDITLQSLRSTIGVVPQAPTLFNDTIMNNVRYARLNATDKEVHEACRAAAVHDKIMSFPDGYGSKVGRRGVKLSGGEQQRIAIARAILKQPQIILLDEATSAVDTETEQIIQKAFSALCKDRTTFVVAHRLSTIMKAARILVVKDGEIIEDGCHDDLVSAKGKYYDLWSKQIMVKPAEDNLRFGSAEDKDVNIVNDVDMTQSTTSLETVLTKTAHSDQEDSDCLPAQVKEVPKLKPEAPEFVPRHFFTSTDTTDDTYRVKLSQRSLDKFGKEKEINQQTEKENLKNQTSVKKSADLRATPSDLKQAATVETTESELVVSMSVAKGFDNKPQIRHPRFGRRHESKSEPSSQGRDSIDGFLEPTETAISPCEVRPMVGNLVHLQRRLVSAPSNPPSGQDFHTSSPRGRSRRTRHWRLKNKMADKSASAVTPPTASSIPLNSPSTLPTSTIQTVQNSPVK